MKDEIGPRRFDDVAIAELSQMLRDHIARYDRDIALSLVRDKADYEHTQAWRKQMDIIQREQNEKLAMIIPVHFEMVKKIKENSDLLSEMSPNYKRGMWVVGAIVLGFIGAGVKMIVDHFTWK